jgi:hypothetical protein
MVVFIVAATCAMIVFWALRQHRLLSWTLARLNDFLHWYEERIPYAS